MGAQREPQLPRPPMEGYKQRGHADQHTFGGVATRATDTVNIVP